ncbi:hypothetical protein CEUSTIGMA_g7409.t1 [Chlamydomonas eustigma]|uniref:Sugar phosphate transporter domain-containing protein n=1 Tax=Chlamydomonas eustigma TaxID=1157962 RepID=A0A250XB31_9CHLO|nr:hypothetical protein CEUSTIGMA_g7409.t1 [Chlamydomonas eustigma]|eukprot:GAX79970.1 hypothetical protein CEUSTIGMA_g7409.t1 [Chlamydomonas eustigma]
MRKSSVQDEEKASLLQETDNDIAAARIQEGGSASNVLIAGVLYILTSSSLILFNKHALASFEFTCPNALLCFHCMLAVLLVKTAEMLGFIQLEPIRWSIVKIWMPVNLIFVAMVMTGYVALQGIGIGIFTVLKNLANVFIILGDWWFFSKTYSAMVWTSLGLMILSAAAGAYHDAVFDPVAYAWQLLNCVLTAAYALYLSSTMERVAPYTSNTGRLSEFSMVYYNNLLSIGPVMLLMAVFGEFKKLPQQEALQNTEFVIVAVVGGFLGFGISFSSLWYVSQSSATIFGLTGSLNKILVAVSGILIFREPTSPQSLISIAIGLAAGVVFAFAKAMPKSDKR